MNPPTFRIFGGPARLLSMAVCLVIVPFAARAQVSPAEVLNPQLKALEETYFPQLKTINQEIGRTKFPFPFFLSRYVGIDPAKQVQVDSRGIEFVRFQDRIILKISGNYNAAYPTQNFSQNERAANTFRTVILPSLKIVTATLPEDVSCDGIGFEIAYHTRTNARSYDYEGQENLVVVLDRLDAWGMSKSATDAELQEIVNRSKVFLSGKDYGLSLTERDPINVESLPRSVPARIDATSTARSITSVNRSAVLKGQIAPTATTPPASPALAPAPTEIAVPVTKEADPPPPPPKLTQADADRLGEKFQPQLDALAKTGTQKFHFVDYAPPAFMVFQNKIALQVTLKNPMQFGPTKSSIYKRAAQTFDLFLAGQLKDLTERVPKELDFQLFDFSVLNKLAPGPKGTSEAIEFICPKPAVLQFVSAEITNQQLLDQSIILVNGVRISLNLQLVE
jgi:hypothetical protein